MSSQTVSKTDPLRFDALRFGTNGQTASPSAFARLADGYNHVLGRRKKQWLCRAIDLSNVPGGGGSVAMWPIYGRTGKLSTMLTVHAGMAQSDAGSASPSLLMAMYTAATTTLFQSKSISFNGQTTGLSIQPNHIDHQQIVFTGMTPDTEYYILSSGLNGVRLAYLMAEETVDFTLDDATDPVCNPSSATAEAPILDGDIQNLVTAGNDSWKKNGSPLLAWTADYDVTAAPVTVSTSYTDLLTGTADTRRFFMPNASRTTYTRTTVPVKLAVKARRDSGAGTCDVRLYDGTNSIAVTGMDNSATHDWYTATGTIPAADTATWQIQAKHSGSDAFRVIAVYLLPYEA